MFLKITEKRNPLLIETAIQLHQKGIVQPDTYVLDLDMILSNGEKLVEEAAKENIDLFFMTKQIGRNPFVARELSKLPFKGVVAVDYREALVMMENNIALGNVGHLVQIPNRLLKKIMEYGTSFITVYSIEKLKVIDEIARNLKIVQNILIKLQETDDLIYDGQHAGFSLFELPYLIKEFQNLTNVKISGLTSFPCFLFENHEITATSNLRTLNAAKKIFQNHKIKIEIINMPSATCVASIPKIKSLGGNQGEPGHALTGTTPIHASTIQPEIPSMVYVSEISHHKNNHSYFYGGGYYRRGQWENSLVVQNETKKYDTVLSFDSTNIDYYIGLQGQHPIGATVIAAFRTQIFVTRSEVAVVTGIQRDEPRLMGIYDSQGRYLRGGA